MSRWILIVLILCLVAGLHPAPVTAAEAQTIENCWDGERLRPVPGRWYKVASRIDDDWPDGATIALTPEPGMPQALGYASWQAMYEDAVSLDGRITDIGLWFDRNFGSEATNILVQHPAGLVPEGRPFMGSQERWMYFTWNLNHMGTYMHGTNQAMIRIQGVPDFPDGWIGPVMMLEIGTNFGSDVEFSLYVKM